MMKGLRTLFCAGLLLLAACGPKKTKAPVVLTRDFPVAEIPMMVTDPQERMVWLCDHFWDRFTATDSLYYCDSVTVNGVSILKLEEQVGTFATLLDQVPLKQGMRSMELFYDRLEAFQQAKPAGNVLPETVALASRYFYDPNSPVRNEDLYLPFVSRLAQSALIREDYRAGYAWDAQMCALNHRHPGGRFRLHRHRRQAPHTVRHQGKIYPSHLRQPRLPRLQGTAGDHGECAGNIGPHRRRKPAGDGHLH